MITAFYTFYAYGTVFAICELSEHVGNLFNKINDIFGQLDWYLFPEKIQKMLPIVLAMTQQPIEIGCFGSIACTRETFKKVKFQQFLKTTSFYYYHYLLDHLIFSRLLTKCIHL